jgi:hypothetical protein
MLIGMDVAIKATTVANRATTGPCDPMKTKLTTIVMLIMINKLRNLRISITASFKPFISCPPFDYWQLRP